jgi:hypothetical protein
MSEDNSELLTGRAGNEAAQGYEPMPMAVPEPDPEPAIDLDSALVKHLQRPAPPEPTIRQYNDVETGEPRPDNETLPSPERAAADLSAAREAERREVERAENEALNRELDETTQTLDVLRAAEAP